MKYKDNRFLSSNKLIIRPVPYPLINISDPHYSKVIVLVKVYIDIIK